MGMERLIELLEIEGRKVQVPAPDAYLATLGDAAELVGIGVAEALRTEGLSVLSNFAGGNFKKQLKRADNSGARFALIIGDSELEQGVVGVKDLRSDTNQTSVARDDLGAYLKQALNQAH